MGKTNRGKQFEQQVKLGFNAVENCSIDRLPDQMNGFAGGSNICDFIAYKHPNQFYLECKSCYGNTLNFNNITDTQWSGLLEKSSIEGVVAGVLIWFIDHDITLFMPITSLESMKQDGDKSVNVKYYDIENYYVVKATKKRIFFDYDMLTFLQDWGDTY